MIKSYNSFYTGESQDDFLTAGGRLIETSGVTGLRDGYGLTLGVRTNKKLLTNQKVNKISLYPSSAYDTPERHLLLCDGGEIYKLDGADNTPAYTHTGGKRIIERFELSFYTYFIVKETSSSNPSLSIMRETTTNVYNGTFATINETWLPTGTLNSFFTPPILKVGGMVYIGGLNELYRYDSTPTLTTYNYFLGSIVGITLHQGVFVIYTTAKLVYFWNGLVSSDPSFSNSSQILEFSPRKVVQKSDGDYIISDDGQLYIGSGASFQNITHKRKTNRGNDNSQYVWKQDFSPLDTDGQTVEVARDKIYLATDGMYEFGNIFPGLTKGMFKSVVYNNSNTGIDKVYDIAYNSPSRELMFSYKAGDTYGVDYIDLDGKETNQLGYAVTEVFAGYSDGVITFRKQLDAIRYTTSFTSGDNYIKLYKRINNGSWELIKTINNATDTIDFKDLRTEKDIFIDIQFKIEFYNADKGENPPTLHGLEKQYEPLK